MRSSLCVLLCGGLGAALGDVSCKAAGSAPGNSVDAAFVCLPGLNVGGSPASTGLRGGVTAGGHVCPSRQPPRLSSGVAMSGSGDGEMKLHGAASDYLKKIPSHLQGMAIRNVKVDLGSQRQGKGKIEYKGDGTPSLRDIQAEIDEEDEREFSEIAMNILDDLEVDVSNFDGVGALFPHRKRPLLHIFAFPSSSSPPPTISPARPTLPVPTGEFAPGAHACIQTCNPASTREARGSSH